MDKKILITFVIAQIILIGSLMVLASSESQQSIVKEDLIARCSEDCGSCTESCNTEGQCNQGNSSLCDGSGSCQKNNENTKTCDTDCTGSGRCKDSTVSRNQCGSSSSCSGSCIN